MRRVGTLFLLFNCLVCIVFFVCVLLVADDEDTSVVTAGSLTTVVVYLKRMGLLVSCKTGFENLFLLW